MAIKVLIKEPGKAPKMETITPTLKNLQKILDGYVDYFRIPSHPDMCVIYDEDAQLKDKPWNITLHEKNDDFFEAILCGTVIFAGIPKRDDFLSLPVSEAELKKIYPDVFK